MNKQDKNFANLTSGFLGTWVLLAFAAIYNCMDSRAMERNLQPLKEAYNYCQNISEYEDWNRPRITPLSSDLEFSCAQIDDLYHKLIK